MLEHIFPKGTHLNFTYDINGPCGKVTFVGCAGTAVILSPYFFERNVNFSRVLKDDKWSIFSPVGEPYAFTSLVDTQWCTRTIFIAWIAATVTPFSPRLKGPADSCISLLNTSPRPLGLIWMTDSPADLFSGIYLLARVRFQDLWIQLFPLQRLLRFSSKNFNAACHFSFGHWALRKFWKCPSSVRCFSDCNFLSITLSCLYISTNFSFAPQL